MIELTDTEAVLSEATVTIPLSLAAPVQRGSVDVWLSRTREGPPARGALVRQLVTRDGTIAAVTFYARDCRAEWPKGGRAFVVASYAGGVFACGVVRLVVP